MPDVVVVDEGSVSVVVVDEPVAVVTTHPAGGADVSTAGSVLVQEFDIVGIQGRQGDQGIQGLTGLQGTPGAAGASAINPVVFRQATPEMAWIILHGLNTYPLVTVVDSANQTVLGDISYLDLNTVLLSFSAPFSGTAYLI